MTTEQQTTAARRPNPSPGVAAGEVAGCRAFERGLHLAIAALAIERHQPSEQEWTIIQNAAANARSTQLDELLLEATAPSRECADPGWFWAFTREDDARTIIMARLRGYMPEELLEDAAKAAAAVIFGAAVRIERRQHDEQREIDALCAVMRKAVNNAA